MTTATEMVGVFKVFSISQLPFWFKDPCLIGCKAVAVGRTKWFQDPALITYPCLYVQVKYSFMPFETWNKKCHLLIWEFLHSFVNLFKKILPNIFFKNFTCIVIKDDKRFAKHREQVEFKKNNTTLLMLMANLIYNIGSCSFQCPMGRIQLGEDSSQSLHRFTEIKSFKLYFQGKGQICHFDCEQF